MDLFLLLLAVGLGYVIGWHHHAWTMLRRMIENPAVFTDMLNKLKEIDKETVSESTEQTSIRTEFLHGQCYIYDGETFLAQGADLHEALSNAEKRFPGQYNFTLRLTVPNESNQSS
jgi:hypothetical protein